LHGGQAGSRYFFVAAKHGKQASDLGRRTSDVKDEFTAPVHPFT
jgi:hypothetical protein